MAISIDDLVQDLSKEEIYDALVSVAELFGVTIPTTQPGARQEPIYFLLIIICEQLSRLWNNFIVKTIRSAFLDWATGGWLTLLAFTVYGVFKNEETFATGPVTFENRNIGAPFTFVAGDLKVKNEATGKTYKNSEGGFLAGWSGSGPYPTVTLTMVADEAGADSSAAIGEIDGYPTTPVVAPAGVFAVSNNAPLIGQDEEDDESLRERCRLSPSELAAAAPKSRYELVARVVRADPDGNPLMPWEDGYEAARALNITRVRVIDLGGATLKIALASASGAASGDDSTEGTDVYIANLAIQLWAVPDGLFAQVAAATEVAVTADMLVFVDRKANVTAEDAETAANAALADHFAKLPIGGYSKTHGGQGFVFKNEYEAAASSPVGIFVAESDGADVALEPDEVAVPDITVTANVVTQ